jgi:hypothetical protein
MMLTEKQLNARARFVAESFLTPVSNLQVPFESAMRMLNSISSINDSMRYAALHYTREAGGILLEWQIQMRETIAAFGTTKYKYIISK